MVFVIVLYINFYFYSAAEEGAADAGGDCRGNSERHWDGHLATISGHSGVAAVAGDIQQ